MLNFIQNVARPDVPPQLTLREKAEHKDSEDLERIKYFKPKTVAEIESDSVNGFTWLCFFLYRKNDFMVQYLLDKGVSINQPNLNGEMPLIVAARFGNERGYLRLMQKGAGIVLSQEHIQKILSLACSSGCLTIVNDALKRGADVNYKSRVVFCSDNRQKQIVYVAPMHLACNYNDYVGGEVDSIAEYIRPKGVIPSLEIIKLLVASGAEINAVYKIRDWCIGDANVPLDKDLGGHAQEFPLLLILMMGNLFDIVVCNESEQKLRTANKEIISFLVSVGANIDQVNFFLKTKGCGHLFYGDEGKFIEELVSQQLLTDVARLRDDLVARKQVSHSMASTSSTAMPSSASTNPVVDTSAVKLPEASKAQQNVAIESRD